MFEIFTSRARPTAASQAAKTRIVMGMVMEIMELEFNVDVEVMINRDNIIPSRQRRVDIKWERNMKVPSRDSIKAKVKFRKADVIVGNYDYYHSLMSRNH